MRIAYLSSSTIPSRTANSIHVMRMCQAFARNGHDVVLCAPDHKNVEPGVGDVHAYYGVEDCFRIVKLPWVPLKFWVPVCGFLAARQARKCGAEVVYGRNLTGCYFSAAMGLPTIFESHQPVSESNVVSRWLFQRMISNNNLKRLVVITGALRDFYREHYPELKDKILVAADGADAMDGQVLAEGVMPPVMGQVRAGYVGHLYDGRGIELLVELAGRVPDVSFHFVGGTDKHVALWQGRTPGLRNTTFHGFVPPNQTAGFRSGCDILLAPYQRRVSVHGGGGDTSAWMSPLKIFEYMAAGKAIICSDLPVLREVLTDGRNALLCSPDDIDSWARALVRLRDDPDLREKLGRTACQDFLDNFTWTARASRVLSGERLPKVALGQTAAQSGRNSCSCPERRIGAGTSLRQAGE